MISTHTPKMFNARIKSKAISAKIEEKIPDCIICSQTTFMRKEMWAAPENAADMKKCREAILNLHDDFNHEPFLPDIKDPKLKQILIPVDWRNDKYFSVTPVSSMGVMHELYHRLYEQNLPFRKWIIQPTPASMSNHGESLLMQGGAVRLLRRGPSKIPKGNWRGDFVQLTARCEGMNISSGMIAVGFPAITAIGGFIHSLERKIGEDIEFAFGIKSADWVSGVPKITLNKNSYGSSCGHIKGGTVTPGSGYSTEEIVANCDIVLLLKTNADLVELQDILINTHRLSGGRLFDVESSVITDGIPPHASYLLDSSSDISLKRKKEGVDSLQAALEMYSMGGSWINRKWHQSRNSYTLNQTGYAFLERPVARGMSRGNYPHAWSEPTFSLITQSSMKESCWWSKNINEAGIFWSGNPVI